MKSGTYENGDFCVCFSADSERADFGVRGSPVWDEVDLASARVDSVMILGVEVPFESLPEKLKTAIMALSSEVEYN